MIVAVAPRVLREIIERAVAHQPDMECIKAWGDSELSAAIRSSAADVLVLTDEEDPNSAPERLFVETPALKVFVLADEGRVAHLIELRQTPVARVSPQGLVDAIRSVMT